MGKNGTKREIEKTAQKEKYSIQYSETFWEDSEKIYESLKGFSKTLNNRLKTQLYKKLQFLKESPFMYQMIGKNKNLRRFFIQKYVVIYEIEKNFIIIRRILAQKSNYNSQIIHKEKSIK